MKAQTLLIIPFSHFGIDYRVGLDKSVSCAEVSTKIHFDVNSLLEVWILLVLSQIIPCSSNSAAAVQIRLFWVMTSEIETHILPTDCSTSVMECTQTETARIKTK